MNRFFAAACLAAGLGLLASGCHGPAATRSSPAPAESQTATPTAQPSAILPSTPPAKVVVYVLNPKATTEETLLMPREVAVKHPESPAKDAVDALLEERHSPLAPGVALRGISVDGGVAMLDFSRNPVNETGGEDAQSTALKAIALTLGQFPEISQYQIKVQGQTVQSFGEFTADGPMDVARPGTALEAKGSP